MPIWVRGMICFGCCDGHHTHNRSIMIRWLFWYRRFDVSVVVMARHNGGVQRDCELLRDEIGVRQGGQLLPQVERVSEGAQALPAVRRRGGQRSHRRRGASLTHCLHFEAHVWIRKNAPSLLRLSHSHTVAIRNTRLDSKECSVLFARLSPSKSQLF